MSAREEILSRLRTATRDVTTPAGSRGEVPRIAATGDSPGATLELFAENVADYRATVQRCSPTDVGAVVAGALARAAAHTVLVPSGLDPAWVATLRDSGIRVLADEGEGGVPSSPTSWTGSTPW